MPLANNQNKLPDLTVGQFVFILAKAAAYIFFKANQQTALFGVIAAQSSACVDQHIHLLHCAEDHPLERLGSIFVHAAGDAHLAFGQTEALQPATPTQQGRKINSPRWVAPEVSVWYNIYNCIARVGATD